MHQCKALQRRPVQEALICSDDRNAGKVAVVQNQARWRYGARKPKRQNNAKRFAGPDLVGKQSRRSRSARQRRRAGPVALPLLILQLSSRIKCALTDPLGVAHGTKSGRSLGRRGACSAATQFTRCEPPARAGARSLQPCALESEQCDGLINAAANWQAS